MARHRLPEMHYITEPERAQLYPAIIRVSSIPSIPPTFPFAVPQSPPRNRGPRYTIGWLEFQSPEQPDPDVARPGDVWIQLPIGHRKARVYACYARDGNDWSPWVGNAATVLSDRTLVRTHPFLNSDHAQRRFYLVFNGHEFTWSNIKAISIIHHQYDHIAAMGPADTVAKWLEVSGNRGSLRARKLNKERAAAAAAAAAAERPQTPATRDKRSAISAPPFSNRKRPRRPSTKAAAATESSSAPPAKKAKGTRNDRSPSPSDPSPRVRSGPYAKAGATQSGWLMYIAGEQLKMPSPCSSCSRDRAPCSGLPGQRCGRCRFRKQWCSHSNTSRRRPLTRSETDSDSDSDSDSEAETAEDTRASSVVTKSKSRLRRVPQKLRTSTRIKDGARSPTKSDTDSDTDSDSDSEAETAEDTRASSVVTKSKSRLRRVPQKLRTSTRIKDGARRKGNAPLLRARFSTTGSESDSSSPLSSVDSHSNPDSGSSDRGKDKDDELDAPDDRDDVAVENLLNSTSAAPITSFAGLAGGAGADDGEPSSSVTAADNSGGGIYRSLLGAGPAMEEDEEEEELTRFVQMTLDGMARVQEGLRGVFTLQRRRSGVARRRSTSPAKRVAGT